MERKQSTIYGIKGKLISAVCMLLVAVTMVVSSTYAWFTLSTAPEVSGITTAVGANGALEIWLNTSNHTDENYKPGNIVNLSQGYGLEQVTLLPSQLNMTGNGTIDPRFLLIPDYIENGKPSSALNGGRTEAGVLNGDKFFANASSTGVRAVGVASGLSDRQLAYRNAKYSASTNASLATTTAATSLNTNGAILGNVVIKKATVANATYTPDEVEALGRIINDLKTSTAYIETAYKEMIIAFAASGMGDQDELPDVVYSTIKANFADGTLTLADIATSGTIAVGSESVSIQGTNLLAGIEALQTTIGNIGDAEDAYTTLVATTAESYTWDQISPIINKLIEMDKATLNKNSISGVSMEDLANSVMNEGINIGLNDGAGVYVEIAAHCGNYSANVTMENVKAGSFTFDKLTANMATNSTQDPKFLEGSLRQVEAAGGPAGAGTGEMPMTEFYGYIIDLGFKTNAANSNLLLQTEAVDRIYKDNNNEATQGKGSYMTYKAVTTELTTEQVKGLMDCVRIVFFVTESREVLGEARLDTANATIGADGVTAKMYMYKDGALQNGENDDYSITSLDQNSEVHVSVLVYLDGETIGNDDVSATDVKSVTGMMNLQFASDADLKPMEYGDLHTPNAAATTVAG